MSPKISLKFHEINDARIQTHGLQNMRLLPLPLDQAQWNLDPPICGKNVLQFSPQQMLWTNLARQHLYQQMIGAIMASSAIFVFVYEWSK